jgi:hypothetical protein
VWTAAADSWSLEASLLQLVDKGAVESVWVVDGARKCFFLCQIVATCGGAAGQCVCKGGRHICHICLLMRLLEFGSTC